MVNKVVSYWALCKPRVVALILLTALVGMLLTVHPPIAWDWPQLWRAGVGLLAIGLSAASGGVINQIIEQSIDARMTRTQKRPLPMGNTTQKKAWFLGMGMGLLGIGLLVVFVNMRTAWLTLGSLIGYGFVYTLLLKRHTPQNIVIGGLSGAMPPLLGWSAVADRIEAFPVVLVVIIFLWTPPHFWALAIDRIDDYQKSGLPMLPVTHGIAHTKRSIVAYTVLLALATLLPYILGFSGWVYLSCAVVLNLRFLQWVYRLFVCDHHQPALPTFYFSIKYLGVLFLSLMVDHFMCY